LLGKKFSEAVINNIFVYVPYVHNLILLCWPRWLIIISSM